MGIKKESAALSAPRLTENPLSVTDSTANITQLLEIARGGYHGALLVDFGGNHRRMVVGLFVELSLREGEILESRDSSAK